MESAIRMITIQVELDSRRIGGIAMLIPYVDNILASTTCRQMLQGGLTDQLQLPDLLATAEKVSMFIIKQQDGCHIIVRNARQNATAKQAKLDAKHAREVARQENAVVENASNGVVEDALNVEVERCIKCCG